MNKNLALSYFSKLLNLKIDEKTILKLSSGQSARAHAWLKSNNLNATDLNLNGGFSVSQLYGNPKSSIETQQQNNVETKTISHFPQDPIESFGIDIQSIVELFPLGLPSDPKDDPELLALYTFKELSYAQSKPNPLQTLAGLFSAKEAIIKCSKQKKNFADIEILPDENGRPYTPDFLISISHSVDYVVAIATPLLRNLNESKPSGNGRQPKIEQFNDGIARQDHHNSMPVNLSRWLNFTIAVTVFVLACLEIFRAFK